MKKGILAGLSTGLMASFLVGLALAGAPVRSQAQVKVTREQMMFYTSEWKGPRFPDGRPRLSDDLLQRAVNCTIEDIWDFLQSQGYRNQFEGNWHMLHENQPFAGRALTAQYMPSRPDMLTAIRAEGREEHRVSGNNSWPIEQLQPGDIYVADGMGKIIDGTLIGSNLANGIFAHSHDGFVFYGSIRDQEEDREIKGFNGLYKGYDPSAIEGMTLTGINVPIRIGRAIVLPGDLVLAKNEGVLFIPATLAEEAVSRAEFTSLMDDYNFALNREGKNGGQFEGGWDVAKFEGLKKWVEAHPEKLKMSTAEFDKLISEREHPRPRRQY